MWKKSLSALTLAVLAVVGGAAAAHASAAPAVSASPDTIEVGGESTVTATGLGGLETASFGLDATPGGLLIDPATGQESTSAQVAASGGSATVTFTATEAGTFTVAVGDGETVLASTTVTVTASGSGGGGESTFTLSASPTSIEVGAKTTVTATGLGDLTTASFGLDTTTGGTLTDPISGASGTSIQASASGGTSTVDFSATEPGTYTIAVGDGETVGGSTTVTVAAASAAPTPEQTITPISAPVEPTGFPLWATFLIIGLVVVLIAAVVVIVVLARRSAKRGDETTPKP